MVPLFSTDRKRVLITGFCVFEGYKTNPSWEGVKLMNGTKIENDHNIILFRKELAVVYDEVDIIVPQMWYYYQPHLKTFHNICFVLEKMAKKNGYVLSDNARQYAKGYQNPCYGPAAAAVFTNLDVDTICSKFNNGKRKLQDPELRAENDVMMYISSDMIIYPPLNIKKEIKQTLHLHNQDRSLLAIHDTEEARITTDLRKMCTKRVLITGFGPFPEVEINPSWEGVNCMNREEIETKYNIHLFQEKIDVVYSVDESLPKLWAKLQPDLTIHVGVKNEIAQFLLETQAAKGRYTFPDTNNACPVDSIHSSDGPDTICTDLDVDGLCQEFNSNPPAEGITAEKSCEAGKYVCEYTYYTSLSCCGCSKTLFVHVPLKGFSNELIAQGLERILEVCLRQLGN